MKPKPGLFGLEKELKAARDHLVERTVVAFLEDVENRVPTDQEIADHHFWVHFSDTPLARFVRGGVTFTQYFVWRRRHVLALVFPDPQSPLKLRSCRIPEALWPTALRLYIDQYPPNQTTGTA
jgi:hypothetical protein